MITLSVPESDYDRGFIAGLRRAKAIAEATRDLSEEKLELDINVAIQAIQAAIDARKE